MESKSPKMESRPPEVIERLVGLLIPPACREHVLGDLSERYSSPGQYVLDAMRAVPFVLASQVRRSSHTLLVLGELIILWFCFTAGAWWTEGLFFFDSIAV